MTSSKLKQQDQESEIAITHTIGIINLIIGLFFATLTVYIILNQELSINVSISIFGSLLMISGIVRFVNALNDLYVVGVTKNIRIAIAVIITAIGFIISVSPNLDYRKLILYVSLGLTLQGLSRIYVSRVKTKLHPWIRTFILLVGIFSILISITVIVRIDSSLSDLISILAIMYFFGACARFSLGLAAFIPITNSNH